MSFNVTLKGFNGKYVCAEDGGGKYLCMNRDVASEWETFVLVDDSPASLDSGDTVKLQAFNGLYVCAEGGGGWEVNATRPVPAGWETFSIVHADGSPGPVVDGQAIALRAANGQYLGRKKGAFETMMQWANILGAMSDAIGTEETFQIRIIGLGTLKVPPLVYRANNDLGMSHFMDTSVSVSTTTGHLDATTRIWTPLAFAGFKGVVEVFIADGAGTILGRTGPQQYGVDGTWIGVSDRTIHWGHDFEPAAVAKATTVGIWHRAGENVDEVKTAKTLDDLKTIAEAVIAFFGWLL